MECIEKYFPELSSLQKSQFSALDELYSYWNRKINVISRKDIEQLYLRHVLHSLAIGKYIRFTSGTRVLDVGTGGGFPGIPLAILFPDAQFLLVDSVGKKIDVVKAITRSLGLTNCSAVQKRAEMVKGQFDYIVSRAVTSLPVFIEWVKEKLITKSKNTLPNGILALKGGDLTNELSVPYITKEISLSDYFDEDFFETKKLVHVIFQP
jgi:16S rRNA (guanine527-N7)-methyltransferase